MDKLVKIENGNLIVTSREVAKNFGKEHYHVIEAIENKIANLTHENSEVQINNLFILDKFEHRGNIYNKYLLTRDGFSFLVMGFTGSKADQWKLRYIEAFNKMEKILKEQMPEINSKFMYQLAGQLEKKEKQIALMKPKVVFADAIETSKQSVLVGELAKLLARNDVEGMGQNRLFKWLRGNGFLHKRGEQYNLPTQLSIELGIIETKVTTINNPDGSIRVTKTPKITGKGQIYFVNKLKEKNIA